MRFPAVLALLVLASAPALAAEPASPAAPKPVTISLRDRPLREAVEELFRGTGARFRVETGVPNVAVTLSLRDVPLETAAKLVVYVAGGGVPGLQVDRDGETFVYRIGTAAVPDPALRPEKDPRLEEKITVNLPEATLREALAALFGKAGVNWVVQPHVPNVTLKLQLKDATVKEGLDALVQQAYVSLPMLYLAQEGPVYVVGLRARAMPPTAKNLPRPDMPGTLLLRDVGLRAALRILFRGSGLECKVAEGIPDAKLTANIRDKTLEDALKQIAETLKQQGVPARFTRQDKIYHLEPAGDEA